VVTLLALFRRPSDEEAFLRHYREVHLPLARRMPGLVFLRHGRVRERILGQEDLFYRAELGFPDMATFAAAARSPEGEAATRDLLSFARPLLELVLLDEEGGEEAST
jgi:uncharacterized protein (TIGR02118 family)